MKEKKQAEDYQNILICRFSQLMTDFYLLKNNNDLVHDDCIPQ